MYLQTSEKVMVNFLDVATDLLAFPPQTDISLRNTVMTHFMEKIILIMKW